MPSPTCQVDRTIARFSTIPNSSPMLDLEARGLWEKRLNDTSDSYAFRARTAGYVRYIRDKHLEFCEKPMRRFDLYE